MSEIEINHAIDKILGNTNFDELDITYLPMNEQHEVSEELLGFTLAPADDATGTRRMAPHDDATATMRTAPRDGRCGDMYVGLDSYQGSSLSPPHFATPGICSRPGVYHTSSLIYP